jgi:predicted nucleic acid-binding protein
MDLGKGESEALSLAHHRHLIMITDDRKAARIAERPEINVQTLTTFGLIAMLVEKNDALKARMPDIIVRMSRLAKFKCRLDGNGSLSEGGQ